MGSPLLPWPARQRVHRPTGQVRKWIGKLARATRSCGVALVILAEIAVEMRRLSRQLDAGLDVLRDQAKELAEAEHDYRKAKATTWLQSPEGTVPEREAWVDGETAEARRRRDLSAYPSVGAPVVAECGT